MPKAKDEKILPLSNTLHDLALLRASAVELAALIPTPPANNTQQSEETRTIAEALDKSYEYARLARSILKINDKGEVDAEGERIEAIREKLSNVEEGLAEP